MNIDNCMLGEPINKRVEMVMVEVIIGDLFVVYGELILQLLLLYIGHCVIHPVATTYDSLTLIISISIHIHCQTNNYNTKQTINKSIK